MTLASGRSGQNGSLPSLCFLLHALPASTCSPATHQAEHSGPVHVWALLPTTPSGGWCRWALFLFMRRGVVWWLGAGAQGSDSLGLGSDCTLVSSSLKQG